MSIVLEYIKENAQDAVLFKTEHLITSAKDDADAYSMAVSEVAEMLSKIGNDVKREKYQDLIARKHKIKPALLNKQISQVIQAREKIQVLQEDDFALPAWVKKEEFFLFGFDERIEGVNTGYYFGGSGQKLTKLTNFVLKPLFHIKSKLDNKRMIEITNGFTTSVLEMPSRQMISLEQFCGALFDEGHYLPEGGFTRAHLLKIVNKMGNKFPECRELKILGWQPEGFFAYSNMAYGNELRKFDDLGIVEIEDKKYLSLSVSKVQSDVRAEEDIYENDRYLWYQEAPITFNEWSELLVKVYDQNAWMGIAYAMLTIFRDIVFHVTKVPHLYAYGAVQAGKSEFGDSLSNLFFNSMPAFNLNQGTDFAFFSRMERFRNCPNALNEFDENGIKEEWFRAIKAAYDGEGREKGRGGKEGKTRTQKINCTLILMGQYLSTKDDNSVLSRCIPLAFKDNNNRPEQQVNDFRKLKELEKKGLSGILVELLRHRELVKKSFADTFSKVQRRILDDFLSHGKTVKSRILKNIAAPMAMIELLQKEVKLPFTSDEFYEYGKKMIEQVSNLISESNSLSEFWRTIEFLLDRNEITEGSEFKIETLKEVSVTIDRESDQRKSFDEPKKLLFIRLNIVHTLYTEIFKRKHGKNAPNLDTIRLYMKDQPYWIGTNSGSRFKSAEGRVSNTSSIVLDYDELKVNLERFAEEKHEKKDDRKPITVSGSIFKDAQMMGDILKFSLISLHTTGFPEKTEQVFYTCYVHNVADASAFTDRTKIEVTGLLLEKKSKEKIYLSIDVQEFKIINDQPASELLVAAPGKELPF